ncbi:MAG: hypothetical protein A2X29_11985 [Elusimicrobia bacterium GWA2_64_40]|nr:MAG: hypothetical protein A2X29_11985 [Elusimicrobia bacterium GWA2_64_40]OGR66550.1 MAG: hypothetical protein A2X30_11445 [Elusimicrobia bacterium GWB2_63_16]
MKIFSSFRRGFHRLHLGLYVMFSLMVLFGNATSYYFQTFSLMDLERVKTEVNLAISKHAKGEGYSITDAVQKEIFRPINYHKRDAYRYKNGELEKLEENVNDDGNLDLYFLLLIVWLWPLYRHYFSKKPQDPARIEKRIINLPIVIFVLGWVMAAQLYFVKVASFSELYGPAPLRIKLSLAASSLIFAAFVSYLNLELTGLYIRRRIAGPFFKQNNPHGLKHGLAISLTMRHALMLFSLATVPLLLALYVPSFFNADIFVRLFETRNASIDWLFTYENLRVLAPIALVALLALMVLAFQAVSLILYRVNVQTPMNALVKRMKAVAAGDFDCKTSVLYNDELGQLKGHFNMMLDGLVERDHIKDTFGRYVSLEIAEKIMKSGKVNLAGEEIQATVLFSDIRGFTPLSENLPPKDLIRFLNEYFAYITVPIAGNRGVINKFIGDAVMAIFSPVFGVEDHKAAAVRAALGMRAALREFNALGRYPEVAFGVGVHSGALVAGNVGTETRLEYTVLGDTVNVASRIESHTKTAATEILLSEAVMSGLDRKLFPGIDFMEGEPVLMKGKSKPLVLYKVGPAA